MPLHNTVKNILGLSIWLQLFTLLFISIGLLFPGQAQCEQSAEILFKQGCAWFNQGDYESAIADFTKALELMPNNSKAYNNRGTAWFYKSDYDRAIADYTKALEINPSHSEACFNRGTAWFYKGDYDRAIADFTMALEINPSYSKAYFYRGEARFYQGDYYWAIADYSMALQIDPSYAKAYNQLSWTLAVCPEARFRNGTKAVEMATKALELNPDNHSLDTLAAAYAEAGRFENAITTQKQVINLLKNEKKTAELPEYIARLKSYKAHKPWREKYIASEVSSKNLPRIETITDYLANIRARPTTKSLTIDKLTKGDQIKLIHQEGEWYIIKLDDDRIGWAHQNLFLAKSSAAESNNTELEKRKREVPLIKDAEQPYVKTNNMVTCKVSIGRVRKFPTFDSEIIFKLRKGETVLVVETKDNWNRIELRDGRVGWAHQSLFKIAQNTSDLP